MRRSTEQCKHCKDPITPWTCKTCDKEVANQCKECHRELAHGQVKNTSIHFCGGMGPGYSGHWDNGIRRMEDRGS